MDTQFELRKLIEVAHEVRAERLLAGVSLALRDIYGLCFYVARELHRRHPDLQIMVGDRLTEHGYIQHHWLEFPSSGIFLDPAYDALDPFLLIRAGKISDADFTTTYRNGVDSRFDVDDPRDLPEMVHRPKTAFDPERGTE